MGNIEEIAKRFSDGKPLTDEELDFFITHMQELFAMLHPLGREYNIVRGHVARELNIAKEFRFHREHG